MTPTSKTPPVGGGASRNSGGGSFLDNNSLAELRSQYLAAHLGLPLNYAAIEEFNPPSMPLKESERRADKRRTAIEVTVAELEEGLLGKPLISSDWSFEERSRALIERKNYRETRI